KRGSLYSNRETTEANAAEINNGINAGIENSGNKISIAKIIPAIGLLNAPAIPAAAPQANNIVTSLYCNPKKRPVLEPIAEPLYAIGASKPHDPPKPTVIALVTICE